MHEQYIERCFQLAANGKHFVETNPMVGCVIVHNGKIIAEGYHRQYGAAHAEVNAINAVKDIALLKESTLYVNLEPCAHHGKTPPCADLIIEKQIPKVVCCNGDPNPKVAGQGFLKLQNSGIEVVTGILEEKGRWLNRRFFNWIENKRPYIILKWAESIDGYLSGMEQNRLNNKITNSYSDIIVHRMRRDEAAIVAGTNTVLTDNPQLNVRHITGRNPIRISFDFHERLAGKDLHLLDDTIQTIIFCRNNHPNINKTYINTKYIPIDEQAPFLPQIMEYLYQSHIQSIIVEGGRQILTTFINNALWDEAHVFIGNKIFGGGLQAPKLASLPLSITNIDDDKILCFKNSK